MLLSKKFVKKNEFGIVDGDLTQVSFGLANNQTIFADVTGVSFTNADIRSAEIFYSVKIDATADLFESGKILAIQQGSGWTISQSVNGDNTEVLFNITASGQLQYKSGNYTGFVSGTIKCRALVNSI